MTLPVPVVWSEDCLRHEPGGEVWLGVRDDGTEVPARALVLREALTAAGAPVVPAVRHGDEIVRTVHAPELVDHLAGVWQDWAAAGLPAEYGRDRVVPYVFPTAGMLAGLPERAPPAVHGRAGLFCYDTMTLIGPGSWAAIRGAADAALTAAGLVGSGGRLAYALCRRRRSRVRRRARAFVRHDEVMRTPLPEPGSSRWSLWSQDSFLSIGSRGSVLSVGSVGSALSVGSVGSFASLFSVGSAFSALSLLSARSGLAVMSYRSVRALMSAPQPADGGKAATRHAASH